MSKKKEDKKLTKDQAEKKILVLKKDLFNIRFKKINNQIDNPAQYNQIKKNIARLYTTIKEHKMTKKILKGTVKSSKNNKTIVVEVTRKFKHPFYEKVIKRSKKYHAHDETNKFKEGEEVSIIECKPFQKRKPGR
jgi:small subunit ribosomal protein S17